MTYLLDTNICIYIMKGTPHAVLNKLGTIPAGDIAISVITVSELEFGARKSMFPEKNLASIQKFLSPFFIVDFNHAAAKEYGIVRAQLTAKGLPIGPLDTLLAAQAKSLQYTLVSNNTREFERVDGLLLENWV